MLIAVYCKTFDLFTAKAIGLSGRQAIEAAIHNGWVAVSRPTKLRVQMSVTTVILAVFLPVACIVAAMVLMRLFDVKDATPEQTQSEVERLLSQFICGNRIDTRLSS